MDSKKKEMLKKLQALAERGVGGEQETAKRKLAELMDKYGVSELDLSEGTQESFSLKYRNDQEEKLIIQIAYRLFGKEYREKLYRMRRGKGARSEIIIKCPAPDAVVIKIEYEFYKELWKDEMQLFFEAFVQKHRIFSENTDQTEEESAGKEQTREERQKYMRMAQMMDTMQSRRRPLVAIGKREEE